MDFSKETCPTSGEALEAVWFWFYMINSKKNGSLLTERIDSILILFHILLRFQCLNIIIFFCNKRH